MFKEMISSWRIWAGAAVGVATLYAFIWLASIGCVILGGAKEACGL